MKVGILTIHRIYNHGSFLQAFALKNMIENVLGPQTTEVELIDWPLKSGDIKEYHAPEHYIAKPFGLKFWMHKKMGHDKYCNDVKLNWLWYVLGNKYIEQSRKYLGVSCRPNYRTEYDAIVVGSDESFNCTQDDASWDGLFCFHLNADVIISYAASFGYSTFDRLEQRKVANEVAKGLSGFKVVSVRDLNSAKIVERLIGVRPLINLDPVLIYDYSDLIPEKIDDDNFILVYNYLNRIKEADFIEKVKMFAKQNKLKIISVFEYCPWADENKALKSFEVLRYFQKAKYVVTDTFHGVIMSIKFNKRFGVFVRESNYNKLSYLLSRFGLESQIINIESEFPELLFNPIDWENVNAIIEQERENTLAYLKNNLSVQ